MPAPDDTLAAIDDILTDWHSSPDAATWTAEPPKRLALADFPRLHADPDAMRRTGEAITAQMQASAEAMRPAVERMMRDAPALRWAFAALAGAPRMRDLLDAERRRRAMKSEYARRRRRR